MEDIVTFEIAKKLKEKGFTIPTKSIFGMYNEIGVFHTLTSSADYETCDSGFKCRCYYDYDDFDERDFIAPTISQVLKWLREEKKIHICIDIYDDGWFFDIASFYKEDTGVYEIKLPYKSSKVTPDYDSFEQAAIAGIEYSLDNLI